MKLRNKKELWKENYYNHLEPGFVESWDFSKANTSHESRVQAVSTIASVCYGNNSLKPNFKLFDKLARESIGLPSSSFEFVPVLIDSEKIKIMQNYMEKFILDFGFTLLKNDKLKKELEIENKDIINHILNEIEKVLKKTNHDLELNIIRFGYWINQNYLITNLRALMYDIAFFNYIKENFDINYFSEFKWLFDIEDKIWYNTKPEEIFLIENNFHVFRIKMTIRDARQFLRHRRASYQELSRRYTTLNKIPIDFRLTPKMNTDSNIEYIVKGIEKVNEALENGISMQEARDLLPVSTYTIIWNAWYPDGLRNFFNLRLKSSAQKEIRDISEAMQDLLGVKND